MTLEIIGYISIALALVLVGVLVVISELRIWPKYHTLISVVAFLLSLTHVIISYTILYRGQ
jgi:hypothetical protein